MLQITTKRHPWYSKPDENGDFNLGGLTKSYLDGRLQYFLFLVLGHVVSIDKPAETFEVMSDFIEETNKKNL